MPKEVLVAIENCYTELWEEYDKNRYVYGNFYEMRQEDMEHELWMGFLCYPLADFKSCDGRVKASFVGFLRNREKNWYDVFDLLEYTIKYMQEWADNKNAPACKKMIPFFIKRLNYWFARLDFAYRIVDNEIIEISDDNEIKAIEQASVASGTNVKAHLQKAMQYFPNARNLMQAIRLKSLYLLLKLFAVI